MADKTTNSADTSIDSVLHEDRKFECPPHFAEKAHVKTLEEYEHLYKESVEEPEKFWGRIANDLHWFKNGTACWSGTSPGRSGLLAERSISRITALIGT